APEAFQAIDVNLARRVDLVTVVNLEVTVATEHQRVVDLELVGVDDAPAPNLLHRHAHERLCPDVRDDFHVNQAVPLQDPENGNLPFGSTAAFPFAPAAEVGFVEFHFPAQEGFGIRCVGKNGGADNHDSPVSHL